jgi:DNA-binding response OmpR family regulator
LLADDNPDEAFFIKRAIQQACPESELEVVSSGAQAIERLEQGLDTRQGSTLPDALILDLKMPRLGGFDVLRWLNEHHVECPAIIHTSSDDPADTAAGKQLGAIGYIVKVVGYQPLVRKLTEILSE